MDLMEKRVGHADRPATPRRETPRYAQLMIEGLKEADVTIVTGLPDTLLNSFFWAASEDPDIHYVEVSNEADMPGIVVGAYMGGKRAVMVFENSGIRQACEAIARFNFSYSMPMVMIMPYRGDLGEANWWGHNHARVMEPLLEALRIPFWYVRNLDEIKRSIKRAMRHTASSQWPVALIFAGECVEQIYAAD